MSPEAEPVFHEEQSFRQRRARILLAIPPGGNRGVRIELVKGGTRSERPEGLVSAIGRQRKI